MGTMVNVHEAKTNLSRLLERVESGERITIARAGKPVADLVAHQNVDFVFDLGAGLFVYDDETFDDVDPEIVAMFEGA